MRSFKQKLIVNEKVVQQALGNPMPRNMSPEGC